MCPNMFLLAIASLICYTEAAKILAVYPTPSISHQVPFRKLTQELARRGHEVVIITADPAFEKGNTPENIREIDVHDISYDIWNTRFLKATSTGRKEDLKIQQKIVLEIQIEIMVKQLETPDVQSLIKNETFDLVFTEAWFRSALFFSHIYKVPTISMSTFGGWFDNYPSIGAASHPLLYPNAIVQKLNNRSMWDKITEFYNYWEIISMYDAAEEIENRELRRFAPDMPDLSVLKDNIAMLFLNTHPLWDGNRPVPPSVVFMNGIHTILKKDLPKDLEQYLNSSKTGVVYVSFGTNVKPSLLPEEKIQILVNVFSKLPYNVLWRWDQEELPGRTDNIKIFKWLPQSDLLRHPNIKLFIFQCGLQSTDEAIAGGVPVIGIPMLGDQWYNAEKNEELGIGQSLSMHYLNEKDLETAIHTMISDESYRKNVEHLRSLMSDQPQPAVERVVWWTEHVLRHGGRHLRAPSANMPWREYLELDLILVLLSLALVLTASVVIALYHAVKAISVFKVRKLKQQ